MLGYSWPRNSTVIKASEIASVATLRNRNNRINLLITTKSGKAFRSVATDQAELAQEIRSAIQELQTTDGRQNTDTPTIAPAAPTNF